MMDTSYTKEALLARVPTLAPNGWYASNFEKWNREQSRLRDDEVNARGLQYHAWHRKQFGTDYRPQTIEHKTKMPKRGQFRFKDVSPKAWKALTPKLRAHKMAFTITDSIIRNGENYLTGYADPIGAK